MGVSGAKVVGDDTLVTPFVGKGDVPEVQNGGVLHHLAILCSHVGKVLNLGIIQHLIVLPPRKHHGGAAAAGGRASEADVLPEDSHCCLWLDDDLWLGEIIYEKTAGIVSAGL